MKIEEVDRILKSTLDDLKLSRGERQALKQVAADLDADKRAFLRNRAFVVAREALATESAPEIFEWIEDVIKALDLPPEPRTRSDMAVHFSPGPACLDCIVELTNEARTSIDVCVFTITDDRVAGPILRAHKRGVAIRVISDNEKSLDEGSDIMRMKYAGIPVRIDVSEHHMHHKYAIFDRRTVITGSYNWTRSAAEFNRENIIMSSDPRMIEPFQKSFEELWEMFE